MKNSYCVAIILAVHIPLCGICGSTARNNLPLRKAILGHWKKVTGSSEYEYMPSFKLVSKSEDGDSLVRTWSVISESGDTLKIKVVGVSSWDSSIFELEQEMKFGEDRNRISVTSTMVKGPSKKGKPREFNLIFTGCNLPTDFFDGVNRKDLPLWKALLGNWKKKPKPSSASTSYYYNAFFKLIRRSGSGREQEYKWRILSESEDTLKIRVEKKMPRIAGNRLEEIHEAEIKFSDDRNDITVTETILKYPDIRKGESRVGKVSTYELMYVDSKQRP